MPISPPALDDRTYEDLLADLLARIPAHTPEWTHVRAGDPGRTLLELFAWLGDTLLYRVNLIPEKQRLAFLRLLGLEPRPAIAASGVVTLTFDSDKVEAPVHLPAASAIQKPVRFETRRQIRVYPVVAETYVKRPLRDGERTALQPLLDKLPQVYGLVQEEASLPAKTSLLGFLQERAAKQPRALDLARGARRRTVEYYVTTPVFAGGAAEPDGLDIGRGAGTIDGCLWIALFAPEKAADGEDPVAAVKRALAPDADGVHARVTVGIAPALALLDPLDALGATSSLPESAKVPVVWEVTSGQEGAGMYIGLDPEDGTAGLTKTGVVTLVLPAKIGAPENDTRRNLEAGVGDRPPRLDDPERAKRLVAWLRLRIVQRGAEPPPSLALSWAGFGAVEVDQRTTTFGRQIGESTGLPDQVLSLGATSIEPETLIVEVAEEGRRFEAWARVPDLALAGRDETVYALSAEEGTITFGDGVRGKIPPERARIRVARMRAGGGDAGNLPPGSLRSLTAKGRTLKVSQGLAMTGGRDAEPLAEAEKRIAAILRHRERAVTEDDFRTLASFTPGTRVSRVEVLPRFSPKRRASGVPGVVTVMALPGKVGVLPPAPRADRVFLERVFAHLDPRRALSTELYVIGCEYVPIGLSVAVVPRPGLQEVDVLASVRAALRSYLWPLAPHGPSQTGWPLGGTVRARELEIVVARVDGVEGVSMPRLFTRDALGRWQIVAVEHACDPTEIPLKKWQLPELLDVVAIAGAESPESIDASHRGAGEADIAVPVVPEVC